MEKKPQIEKVYSLSPMQEGMVFHAELNKDSHAYFEQTVFTLKGQLDIKAFEKSFNILINRHDVLRTLFFYKNVQRLSQVVLKERTTDIYYEDIRNIDKAEKEEYIENFMEKDRDKGFDLSRDILVRISILRTADDKYKLIWSFHHIIMDGWCIGIVNKEILEIYSGLINDTSVELGKAPVYKTYIDWLKKQNKEEAKTYWTNYLEDYENRALVPQNKIMETKDSYKKEDLCLKVDEKIKEGLEGVAKKNDTTLNTVLQTIWGLVLQRYNNTDDVVFGSVVSGRGAEIEGIEEMVGLFINTIPVRVKCDLDESFASLIQRIQNKSLDSDKYSYYPLSDIQGCNTLKSGLFDHIVAYENFPIQENLDVLGDNGKMGFALEDVETFEQTNYDFNMVIIPGQEIRIIFKYNSEVYSKEFIKTIGEHITKVSEEIIENPKILVKDIEMLSKDEKERILFDFNDNKTDYPKDKTLQQLFEEQVLKTPDNIAVVHGDRQMTYRELNDKANQLARILRRKGIGKNDLVGMLFKRSPEMIIGIMGILKSGGAYLPIDPEYPETRITGILEDSKASVVLIQEDAADMELLEKIAEIEVMVLDNMWDDLSKEDTDNLEYINDSHDLAYVIYTSGSTGKPKGNLITHFNVSRVVKETNYIDIKDNDTLLQLSNYAFDGSTFDIYGALLNGAKLVMINKDILLDVSRLSELIKDEEITLFFVTTALFNALVDVNIDCFETVRKVLFGGERVSVRHVTKALEYMGTGRILHVYGPTESTVYASFYNVDSIEEKLGTIPIGEPLANTQIYILDKDNKVQPVEIPGELCISGDGLAKGYLNRPELTREKFVPHPHIEGKFLYKTGDLAKWLSNGDIVFLDRIDKQVKLRGFRIELGEIESTLLQHPDIKEAVVLCKDHGESNKVLYGYIVAKSQDKELSVSELRKYLSKDLPDYMIPTYFALLESMPLTPNGKIDKKELEKYEKMDSGVEYVAPRNEIEEILVKAWQEVLGGKKIGINDNYFSQGGDSIKAIQIASRLQRENLKMEIKDLFQHPTIGDLSNYIKTSDKKAEQNVVIGKVNLLPIQKWFFEKQFTDMKHFNHSVMLHSKDGLDENIVKKVFEKIVKHHDALRMVCKTENEGIVQYNRGIDGELFELKTINLVDEKKCISKIEEEGNNVQSSIDLAEGPLMKLRLFKTSNGDHLLIIIHHLVVDGVSWRIILEDFTTGYIQASKGKEVVFQDKTNSFKEWSKEITSYGTSDTMKEEAEYWEEIAKKEISPLPKDKETEENRIKDSEYITIELTKEDTEKLLKDVNETYNTEINDILLSSLGRGLKNWCGQDRFLINMEGHGREDIIEEININRTVGWFTSAYPVVLNMDNTGDIGYCIKNVKDELNRIPNNGIGYGILKYLSSKEIQESVKFNKEPEISFNYLGQFDQDIDTEVFGSSDYPTGDSVSPDMERSYTLDVNGIVKNGKLSLTLSYNKNEYNKETIEKLAQSYKESILDSIEHCIGKDDTEQTPTDFLYNDMSIEELDDLTDGLDDILD